MRDDLDEIRLTYTCPKTGIEVTTTDFSMIGWECNGDFHSDSGVDISIYSCPECGKEHRLSK